MGVTPWFWISLAIPALAGTVTVSFLAWKKHWRNVWDLLAVLSGFFLVDLLVLIGWAFQLAG